MPSHQDKIWIRLWKENSTDLRERVVGWRKQNAITRIEKPSRLQRARRLGYKAKQGIIVVRMRVGTGGMRKQRPTGSYFIYKDGKHYWFEVILADPEHPRIAQDRELNRRISQTA
jgi:large subunit ribosomal protein L15e